MAKMIKMDLYRLFRSTSTWLGLIVSAILAFLMVMLVHTTVSNTAISARIYSNAGELLAAHINSGVPMALCAVEVLLFISAKYKSGFIKNIANQLPRRELLVISEITVSSVASALNFFMYSICTIAAGSVFFGNAFITFSFPDIIKLLMVQFILHWGFCCQLPLFYMLTDSTSFAVAAGLLISFKFLNIFYALVERFTGFNIERYMLDSNIFQLGMDSAKPVYTRAAVVGVAFLSAEIVLLCMVMRKKDIR